MKLRHLTVAALAAPLAAAAQPAVEDTPPPEAWSGDATLAQPGVGDAARAYERVIGRLRQNLPLDFTGDLAADYALRAQALQQAAHDLAREYLAEAPEESAPELRAAAEAAAAREEETLAAIEDWLAANPPPETVPEPETTVPQTGEFTPEPQPRPDAAQ